MFLKDVIMEKCGLVLVVGGIGLGKLIFLVVMIDYWNENLVGYIIIVEDFVEYVYKYKKLMIIYWEVGVDCYFWYNVLKNILC